MASKTTDLAIHAITTFSDQLRRTSKPDGQKLSELLSELRLAAQDERDEAVRVADAANASVQAMNLDLETAREQVVRLRQEVEHLVGEVEKLKGREKESKGRPADDGRPRSLGHEQAPIIQRSEALRERPSRTRKHTPPPPPPPTPTGPAATRVSNARQDRQAEDQRKDSAYDPRPRLPLKSTATTAAAATSSGALKDATRSYDSYMPPVKRLRSDDDAAR